MIQAFTLQAQRVYCKPVSGSKTSALVRHRSAGIHLMSETTSPPANAAAPAFHIWVDVDVADNEIVKRVRAGDLVITSDIPLAAEVIAKGALALSPRGELLTEGNVRPRLNMRDFLDTMRSSGVHTGGPPPLSQRDRQAFANHLDTMITRATEKRLDRPPICPT